MTWVKLYYDWFTWFGSDVEEGIRLVPYKHEKKKRKEKGDTCGGVNGIEEGRWRERDRPWILSGDDRQESDVVCVRDWKRRHSWLWVPEFVSWGKIGRGQRRPSRFKWNYRRQVWTGSMDISIEHHSTYSTDLLKFDSARLTFAIIFEYGPSFNLGSPFNSFNNDPFTVQLRYSRTDPVH
jgi:hypothetical protein